MNKAQVAYPIHLSFLIVFLRTGALWTGFNARVGTPSVTKVIHTLWERQDSNLLIMPSSLPIFSILSK